MVMEMILYYMIWLIFVCTTVILDRSWNDYTDKNMNYKNVEQFQEKSTTVKVFYLHASVSTRTSYVFTCMCTHGISFELKSQERILNMQHLLTRARAATKSMLKTLIKPAPLCFPYAFPALLLSQPLCATQADVR